MKKNLSYIENLVRDSDYDRFMLSMFLPATVRADVWAVLAFNHEIAKTREVVSESTLGHIRLQWWRESIAEIYEGKKIKEHEVIQPLAEAIIRHDLPRELFDNLIYAREFDLEDVLPASIEGLFNYIDFTTMPLMKLIIQISGGGEADFADISNVALHYGVSGLMRATYVLAKQRRFYLPEDLIKQHQIDLDDIFEHSSALPQVVQAVFEARPELVKPKHVFLRGSVALSDVYFKQLRALNYDVMSSKARIDPVFKVLRLFWKTKGLSF